MVYNKNIMNMINSVHAVFQILIVAAAESFRASRYFAKVSGLISYTKLLAGQYFGHAD